MADKLSKEDLQQRIADALAAMERYRDIILTEARDLNPEEDENFEKASKDFDGYKRQLEQIERAEAAMREAAESRARDRFVEKPQERYIREERPRMGRDQLFGAWMRSQRGIDPSNEERSAAAAERVDFNKPYFDFTLPTGRREARALTTQTGGTGGYTIPEGFVARLERAMLAYGGMMEVSEVIVTSGGEDLRWPMVNDTGNSGTIIAENTQVSSTDLAFTSLTLGAFKYTSGVCLIPYEIISDSSFNVANLVADLFGERLARGMNAHFTTGSGATQPRGFTIDATSGKVTATLGTIIATELIDTVHSLDPSYRPNARWMFNDAIIAALRKVTDSSGGSAVLGQFVWQSGWSNNQPDRLLGYPVTVNQAMASAVTASQINGAFGDFSKYKIRLVAGVRVMNLTERYADYDQVGVISFVRADGALLDAGGVPIRLLIQAAA